MIKDDKKLYWFNIRAIIATFLMIIILYGSKLIGSTEPLWFSVFFAIVPCFPWKSLIELKDQFTGNEKKGGKLCKNLTQEENKEKVFVGIVNYSDVSIDKNDSSSPLLDRKRHRENIRKMVAKILCKQKDGDKFHGLFLTGDSGAGKSILINYLEKDFKDDGYQVYVQRGDYHRLDISFQDNESKKIIILDHFQKALDNEQCKKKINVINKKYKNCVFIFSFPHNYFSNVKTFLLNDVACISANYVLTLDSDDEDAYLNKIAKLVNAGIKDVKDVYEKIKKEKHNTQVDKKNVLCNLLYDVVRGRLPLIQLECVGNILCDDIYLKKDYKNNDYILENIDTWVSDFEDKNTAFAILKMFCEYDQYQMDDIRLATFCSRNELEGDGKVLLSLKENIFLSCESGEGGLCTFAPKHEFVSGKFREYIEQQSITNGQSTYIGYLKKVLSDISRNSEKRQLEDNYELYHRNRTGIITSLWIVLIALIGINFYFLNQENDTVYCYQRIATALVCCLSIIYIFSYCYKIMYIRKSIWLTATYVLGSVAMIICNLKMDSWGYCMGGEIIVLALGIMICMRKGISHVAKKQFIKDTCVFLVIGFMVMALSVIYSLLCHKSNSIDNMLFWIMKFSYYVEFILYAALSIYNHSKKSYIANKLGYSNCLKTMD